MQVGEAYLEGVPRPNPSQLVGPHSVPQFLGLPYLRPNGVTYSNVICYGNTYVWYKRLSGVSHAAVPRGWVPGVAKNFLGPHTYAQTVRPISRNLVR